MKIIIKKLEFLFQAIPLSFLEIWGRLGFLVGFFFMVCAFAGVRLKSNGKREFVLEKYNWDGNSLRCMMITFVSVILSGVLGSRTVLVPGVQTFESLKDLSVFLCIVLFYADQIFGKRSFDDLVAQTDVERH